MNYVLITGVSTGIGYTISELLIQKNYHVFGSVRTKSDAKLLTKKFGMANFTPLIFDVTNIVEIQKSVEFVKRTIGNNHLIGLINNAGIATFGPIMHIPVSKIYQQFEVNVIGLLNVSRAFFPLLISPQHENSSQVGRIINISSVSSHISLPFIGLYAASKHAVRSISNSLRLEILSYGIKVVLIEPGIVKTPIWKKDIDISSYQNTNYFKKLEYCLGKFDELKKFSVPISLVAQTIFFALIEPIPKTHYILPGNQIIWCILKNLPNKWLDVLLAWYFKLK